MAWQLRMLAAKPHDLSSVPSIYMGKEENRLPLHAQTQINK